MTIKTTPLSALFYSLGFFLSVCVVSFNYATVEQDRLGRDLIIAKYQQETDIAIANIAQDTIISNDAVKIAEHYRAIASYQEQATGHKAIAEVWGCR